MMEKHFHYRFSLSSLHVSMMDKVLHNSIQCHITINADSSENGKLLGVSQLGFIPL